jgi:hypothetical protein
MEAGTLSRTNGSQPSDRGHVKRRLTWEDVVPFPGNPIYEGRLKAMRRQWGGYDHSLVGSPAIFDNSAGAYPDLPTDVLIVGDGNHRRELARQDGKLSEEFMADLYRGMTRAEIHRYRRGLNDRRAVQPSEVFLELVEEGDPTRRALKEAVEGLGWRITHTDVESGLRYTNELQWIWSRDRGALIRAIQTYEQVWGRKPGVTKVGQGGVIKGLGAFWIKYPDADMGRLVKGVTVKELHESGRNQNASTTFIHSVYEGIRYSLAMGYNRYQRTGKKLPV